VSGILNSGSGLAPWRVDKFHPPFPYEFGDAYVVRVACADRKDGAFAITRLAGCEHWAKSSLFTSPEADLAVVADCMRVPVEELRTRCLPYADEEKEHRSWWGISLYKRELELDRRMFCPTGLVRAAYTRSEWQLRALPFDEETAHVLTDRCHRCGAIQRFGRAAGIENCDRCFTDLRRGTTPAVPEHLLSSLSNALGLVHPDAERRRQTLAMLPPAVADLGSSDAFTLMRHLSVLSDPSLPAVGWLPAVDIDQRLRRLASMAEAWTLLAGWPHAVTELLDCRIAKSMVRHDDGLGGAAVRFFMKASHPRTSTKVARLIEGLRASLRIDQPSGREHAERTLTFQAAAATLMVSTNDLTSVRREGVLKVRFGLKHRLPVALYDRADCEELGALHRSCRTLNRLAWSIRVPIYALEQLVALNLLPLERHPFIVGRFDEPVASLQSMLALTERIERGAEALDEPGTPFIRALFAEEGGMRPWGPAIERLLSGEVRYGFAAGCRLASRILVAKADLPKLRDLAFDRSRHPGVPFSSTISLENACEVLDLKWDPAVKILGPAKAGPENYPLDHVVAIAREHMSVIEIGRRLGLGPAGWRKARDFATRTAIPPLSGWTYPRRAMAKALASHLEAAGPASVAMEL